MRSTNRQLIDKLGESLKREYDSPHYLGRRINCVSRETRQEVSEEILILLKTNQETPIGAIPAEENYQWTLKNELQYNCSGIIREPCRLEATMHCTMGEYYEGAQVEGY